MRNRVAAVLSAGALTLATSPVQAEGRTYNWAMALKDGELQLIDNWSQYWECSRHATWMRNNLNLKGGSSTAFCVEWTSSNRYATSELYITGPESNLFYDYVDATTNDCRKLGRKVVTQLKNRTKFKTWTAKCRLVSSGTSDRRKGKKDRDNWN